MNSIEAINLLTDGVRSLTDAKSQDFLDVRVSTTTCILIINVRGGFPVKLTSLTMPVKGLGQ